MRLAPNEPNAYTRRADVYGKLAQYDKAIEDYGQALKLRPNDAGILSDRGDAYVYMAEFERAIEDYSAALRIDAKRPWDLKARARANFHAKHYAEAARDFSAALETEPQDHYSALWEYLSARRGGAEGRKVLAARAKAIDLEKWPGVVVRFYLGQVKAKQVLAAAQSEDAQKQKEQLCEARFYLGEDALLRGERATATKYFRQTLDEGVPSFVEVHAARNELRALGALAN